LSPCREIPDLFFQKPKEEATGTGKKDGVGRAPGEAREGGFGGSGIRGSGEDVNVFRREAAGARPPGDLRKRV